MGDDDGGGKTHDMGVSGWMTEPHRVPRESGCIQLTTTSFPKLTIGWMA